MRYEYHRYIKYQSDYNRLTTIRISPNPIHADSQKLTFQALEQLEMEQDILSILLMFILQTSVDVYSVTVYIVCLIVHCGTVHLHQFE